MGGAIRIPWTCEFIFWSILGVIEYVCRYLVAKMTGSWTAPSSSHMIYLIFSSSVSSVVFSHEIPERFPYSPACLVCTQGLILILPPAIASTLDLICRSIDLCRQKQCSSRSSLICSGIESSGIMCYLGCGLRVVQCNVSQLQRHQ